MSRRKPQTKSIEELTGRRIGELTVVGYVADKGWLCRCSCGAEIYRKRTGGLRDAIRFNRQSFCNSASHRADLPPLESMPEYSVWMSLRARCNNPKNPGYSRYGGRGIRVDPTWEGRGGFIAFIGDVGRRPTPNHTIERTDNDGNYEPGNCCWDTRKSQARNRRNSKRITINGRSATIAEWAEENNIDYDTIWSRLKRGVAPQQAIDRAQLPNPNYTAYTINNETKTLSEWARVYNIPRNTIRNRMQRNKMSLEDALKAEGGPRPVTTVDQCVAEDLALVRLISSSDPDITAREELSLERAIRRLATNTPLTSPTRRVLKSIAGRLRELTQDD